MESTTFAGFIKPDNRINYSVLSAEIVTEDGNKYLRRILQDAEDEDEEPFALVNFGTRLVELWEKDLMATLGKLKAETEDEVKQLPEKRHFVKYAGKVDFIFPKPMYRLWNTDGEHTMFINGASIKQPHRKGDIVTDGYGVPKEYKGTRVFVKFKKKDSDMFTEGYDYTSACMDALRQFRAIDAEPIATQPVIQVGAPAQMQPVAPSMQQATQAPTQAPQMQAPQMQAQMQTQAPQMQATQQPTQAPVAGI